MSDLYPYFQTLHSFDKEIEAYAIQPSDQLASGILSEEDPAIAFGPLGYINIFVGATNAGKSRFLRSMAKCEKFNTLQSETIHGQIHKLLETSQFLANSEDFLDFEIAFGQYEWHTNYGRNPIERLLPPWAADLLSRFNSETDFKLRCDKFLFQSIRFHIREFLADTLAQGPERTVSSIYNLGIDDISVVKTAAILLKGEIEAIRYDIEKPNSWSLSRSLSKRDSLTAFKFDFSNTNTEWQKAFIDFWETYDELCQAEAVQSISPTNRFHIPVLRSAVSLRDQGGNRLPYDIFAETVRKNYKLEDLKLQIFTGNRLYDTLKRDRNGTPEIVARLRDFESFLGESFYEGRRIEIVALDEAFGDGQHISVRVQGETPRELHDLGDGINTLVILLYQLFMAEPGSWVFIEEPELNLHPGLQRVFLLTLLENEALKSRKLRVFFTTTPITCCA